MSERDFHSEEGLLLQFLRFWDVPLARINFEHVLQADRSTVHDSISSAAEVVAVAATDCNSMRAVLMSREKNTNEVKIFGVCSSVVLWQSNKKKCLSCTD